MTRVTATFLFFLFVLSISLVIAFSTNLYLGFAVFVASLGLFFLQGLHELRADPPTRGILTLLRKALNATVRSGWRFFPLRGLLFGYIEVSAQKVEQKIVDPETQKPPVIKTPDGVDNDMPIVVEWEFDPRNPLPYLESGKEEGVRAILNVIVVERAREYLTLKGEGPQTYKEVRENGEEAVGIFLKAILGDELPRVPSDIPTAILLNYFRATPKQPSESEAKIWGENWSVVQGKLSKLSIPDLTTLIEAVEARRAAIAKVRQGSAAFAKTDLGIIIKRISLGNIEPVGEVATAANEIALAELRREAEAIQLQHVRDQIGEFQGEGINLKPEDAAKLVETERNKIKREVRENEFTLSPLLVAALERVAMAVIHRSKPGEEAN